MPKKNFLDNISSFGKAASYVIPLIGVILTMTWKTYGEPKVMYMVKTEVDTVRSSVIENTKHIKNMNFATKQILLILEKTNDPEIIAEVKRETDRFRPVNQ